MQKQIWLRKTVSINVGALNLTLRCWW
jgi:hypothetical protein